MTTTTSGENRPAPSKKWNASTANTLNGTKNGSSELPVSEEGEKGLICSLLLGGDNVALETTLPRQAFYVPAHRILWEALMDLSAERRPLDFVVVKQRLEILGQLAEIGGKEALAALYDFVPSWSNWKHYAAIVLEAYRVRRAILGTRLMEARLLARGKEPWPELRSGLETEFALMIDDDEDEEMTTKQITADWFDELTTRRERLRREGIGFGLPQIDERIGQQQPGELVTIGAPTSTGKTLLAYQGVVHNLRKGLPVGLVSLEMSRTQTWDRLASYERHVSMNSFRLGVFSEEDNAKLAEFHRRMTAELPFYYTNRREIESIKSWARRAKAKHGIKLLVVDYLQRVTVAARSYRESRQEQVAYVSSELKNLALELGLVVWCPVQLNKENDVRESQAIQFDADVSIRLFLNENSYVSGGITFDKIRQGRRGNPVLVWIAGEFQVIEEQDEPEAT